MLDSDSSGSICGDVIIFDSLPVMVQRGWFGLLFAISWHLTVPWVFACLGDC